MPSIHLTKFKPWRGGEAILCHLICLLRCLSTDWLLTVICAASFLRPEVEAAPVAMCQCHIPLCQSWTVRSVDPPHQWPAVATQWVIFTSNQETWRKLISAVLWYKNKSDQIILILRGPPVKNNGLLDLPPSVGGGNTWLVVLSLNKGRLKCYWWHHRECVFLNKKNWARTRRKVNK